MTDSRPLATAKVLVAQRLGSDWRDLAAELEIPPHHVGRFPPGSEAYAIWEYLEVRHDLHKLPPGLRHVGRGDLADLVKESLHRKPGPSTGKDEPTYAVPDLPRRTSRRILVVSVSAALVATAVVGAAISEAGRSLSFIGASAGALVVTDGGDPTGCTRDAKRFHEQTVFSPSGVRIGTLQLIRSAACDAVWARLDLDQANQPAEGWDVELTVVRSADARPETVRLQVHTTAYYTNVVRDQGECFTARVAVDTPQGVARAETPCTR